MSRGLSTRMKNIMELLRSRQADGRKPLSTVDIASELLGIDVLPKMDRLNGT